MEAVIVAGGLGTPQGMEASLPLRLSSASAAVPDDHIPVYVINLAKDIDRWRRIETSLLGLAISPIRIRAVDGTNRPSLIRRTIKHDFATKDWALTPGEIGCALSHIAVWKKVLRGGLAAVILEDDAEILSSFEHFYFEDLPLFLKRCDVVKFEGLFFKKTSRSGPTLYNGSSTKLIVSFRPTLGAAGYALTPRGAEALLSRAAKIKVTVPIDHLLVRYDEHGAVYGETRPFVVRQASEAFPSNIEAERMIEAQRMQKILNLQCVRFRQVRRVLTLIRRGIRRSLAMLRIIIVTKLFVPHGHALMTRSPNKRELSSRALSMPTAMGL
jgi:GR25 family glycosyltransferase involved in LPS biosynthesis